jgi:hypothetical protein
MNSNAIVQIVSCPSEESDEDAYMLYKKIEKSFYKDYETEESFLPVKNKRRLSSSSDDFKNTFKFDDEEE